METLSITATEESPEVLFNTAEKVFKIVGKSYMEDVQAFYTPILAWVQQFGNSEFRGEYDFILQLEYINTASSKMVLDLLDALQEIREKQKSFTVHWHYDQDDEDMEDQGLEFKDLFTLPILMVPIAL